MEEKINNYKCYICGGNICENGHNLFGTTTDYSNTILHDMLEKLTAQNIKFSNENNCFGCSNCVEKINEYDLAIITAKRVQNELIELLQNTAAKCYQNIVIIRSNSSENLDICNQIILPDEDEITYVVKQIPERELDNEPLEEETDEYEIKFFTGDDDIDSEPEKCRVEPYKSEYVIYENSNKEDNNIIEIVNETIQQNETVSNEKLPLKFRTTKPKKNTNCKQCKTDFGSFKKLSEHRKECHDNGEKLVCDICGVRYKTKAALNIHLDLHKGVSPFRCEICGKHFTQKGALKRHRPIHTGERPYQCEKCGKQFIHYSSFHMHNLAHDDIRDKKCEICGLLLRSSSHLNRHMLVHTGQKPHACPICGQRFAQRYNMMSHYRSHQGIQRRKRFICNVCNKGFTKENLLKKHILEKSCNTDKITVEEIVKNEIETEEIS